MVPDPVETRLEQFLGSWHDPEATAFRVYRENRRDPIGAESVSPCWMLLPSWLTERFGRLDPRGTGSEDFLAQVLWGQYCLFMAIRLWDDLLDDQADDPALSLAAGRFLNESNRVFYRQSGDDSEFMERFHDCLRRTTDAILDVDRLQRRPTGMGPGTAGKYAEVGAIFELGPTAVCRRYGREDALAAALGFLHELAIAAQIFDDLCDIEEDMARGRYNLVASSMLRQGRQDVKAPLGAIAQRLVLGNGLRVVVGRAERHFEQARKAIAPLGIAAANEYVDLCLRNLGEYQADFHRARVGSLLAGL